MASQISIGTVEKLMGRENYPTWKFAVKNYLEHEDLWDTIEPSAGYVQDRKKDVKARSKIILLIDPINYVHVQEATTAKQVWSKLERLFDDSGLSRRVGLLRDLISTTLDSSSSVEDYINKVMTTAHKLRNINFVVGDEWLGTLLLAGLPDVYKPMIMAIESSGMLITADFVKTKLLQDIKVTDTSAYYIKSKKTQNRSKSHKDSPDNIQQKGPRCYNCNRYGHFSKNCYIQKKRKSQSDNGIKNNGYYAAFSVAGTLDKTRWYIDSGASQHMCRERKWMYDVSPTTINNIKVADNKTIAVEGCGKVNLQIRDSEGRPRTIQVRNVLYVPSLTTNLLSVSQMTKNGCEIDFEKDYCRIYQNKKLILTAFQHDNMYVLKDFSETPALLSIVDEKDINLWHQRMGHLNFTDLQKIENSADGVELSKKVSQICTTCMEGKMNRLPFKNIGTRASEPLQLIHTDLCGPMETSSIGGAKYYITFIDDYSRKVYVYFMKNKSDTLEMFKQFKNLVENETEKRIKVLRSDNGKEYINKEFKLFLEKFGIQHQTTNPYTPEQNGLAERMNRTLVERAKCMILNSSLAKHFWAEAVSTAAYVINRSPTKALDYKTPYEQWSGKKPNIKNMRIFGCEAMVHVPKEKRLKWDSKAVKMLFVGYCEYTKGYRFYDKNKKQIYKSRDAIFLEHTIKNNNVIMPLSELQGNASEDSSQTNDSHNKSSTDTPESPSSENMTLNESMKKEELSDDDCSYHTDNADDEYIPDKKISDVSSHKMMLRPRNNKHNTYLCESLNESKQAIALLVKEPDTMEEALSGLNAKEWKNAMNNEYESLLQNNTWTLVTLPEGKRAIPCKWVYKMKTNADGEVVRYKARLVIKGFIQKKGIEYNEIFAPVVRHTSIRYLLALAVKYNLFIVQMDAVTAFLQGDIDTEIYMLQPPSYEYGEEVCKLNKSIYGLKQASRQWNLKLTSVLKELGLKSTSVDPCIYHKTYDGIILFILIYVDDLLLFYNNEEIGKEIKQQLKCKFNMKELGNVQHFIGWRIKQNLTRDEISIDQTVYIEKILQRFNMSDCNPVHTPCEPNVKLISTENKKNILTNIPYQEAIGSLLYLSQGTRPDICFIVNKLSSFNKKPEQQHWLALKRVLRYIKGTKDYKLIFKKNKEDKRLFGYCDSDWASDVNSRRSCSGYTFMFQGAAISWCSKRQSTVALSTMEAEYMSLATATQEAMWLRHLESELHHNIGNSPTVIYCDNQSAIKFAGTESYCARSKHIDIRYHFLREKIATNKIEVIYIGTENMVADILTKSTSQMKIQNCIRVMGLCLKGGC